VLAILHRIRGHLQSAVSYAGEETLAAARAEVLPDPRRRLSPTSAESAPYRPANVPSSSMAGVRPAGPPALPDPGRGADRIFDRRLAQSAPQPHACGVSSITDAAEWPGRGTVRAQRPGVEGAPLSWELLTGPRVARREVAG
jgi:hypothetical protein